MKIPSFAPVAAMVVLGAAGWIVPQMHAQAFARDIMQVKIPYPVTVGEKTLPPGTYTIKPMPEAGDAPVLMITNNQGVTMAMTAMSERLRPPESSSISLYRLGKTYYLSTVWIEGNPFGYRMLLPESVRNREREMESVKLPGQ